MESTSNDSPIVQHIHTHLTLYQGLGAVLGLSTARPPGLRSGGGACGQQRQLRSRDRYEKEVT